MVTTLDNSLRTTDLRWEPRWEPSGHRDFFGSRQVDTGKILRFPPNLHKIPLKVLLQVTVCIVIKRVWHYEAFLPAVYSVSPACLTNLLESQAA